MDYTPQIRELMRLRQIKTFRELRDRTGISEKQLLKLRKGELQQLKLETLTQFATKLDLSLAELLALFELIPSLQKEYDRLKAQLSEQRETLLQEFQQSSLQTLEPWLLQWSAAAYAAQQNPQAPAVKLLPLVRPIEQLLQNWGIEQSAIVGSEIPYDPQQQQLMGGMAEAGDLVRVRYAGYRQGERLLYRAKVSPV
ncbi:MAG: helix-turn-helix transcriptional regulator [Leptolyngbya sp. UWPOB_LEPTO1]|uniref:helix-turn-helix domain-containing protein n=1 Tax=Leptolyngbya sp. UWPOB_LEPTO1 TaxID=2815653 RepID=UPI001AC6B465|nr:helix-turn-helix transcriptional regulator [Leptolyngbya sp. UWPOB_LEPTO1]MBN8563307.1 helix-turn-helix transcriptional regulator [Leptolyngbya sp. UWPOB_LEPTO1]